MVRKHVALHFYHRNIFIMVLINTGTTGKLNRSNVPPRSSTYQAIFTQFSFAHRINPKEWKRIGVFYYFQGQFHIFKGNFTKFQDNSRTNGTILKFQELSRTKVKFKDFSRSVRTLFMFSQQLYNKYLRQGRFSIPICDKFS